MGIMLKSPWWAVGVFCLILSLIGANVLQHDVINRERAAHKRALELVRHELAQAGLQAQVNQASAATVAETKIITKIKTVEVVRDRIIQEAEQSQGLAKPIDAELRRGLIGAYERLRAETQAADRAKDRDSAGQADSPALSQNTVPHD
jgi:hypothetical protein